MCAFVYAFVHLPHFVFLPKLTWSCGKEEQGAGWEGLWDPVSASLICVLVFVLKGPYFFQ